MKKVIMLLLMLLLMMAVFCEAAGDPVGKVPESKAGEVEVKIALALEQFESNRVAKGFRSLLDALRLTVPHTVYPGEVGDMILSASDHCGDNGLDTEAYRLLRRAYNKLKKSREAGVSPASTVPAPVAQGFHKILLAAREEIKKGNGEKAVEYILEGILLTSPRVH